MTNPIYYLLSTILDLYSMAVFAWVILGLLIYFNIANRTSPIVSKIDEFLTALIDPALKPIRKYVPPISGVDISPVILIVLLGFLDHLLFYLFFRM